MRRYGSVVWEAVRVLDAKHTFELFETATQVCSNSRHTFQLVDGIHSVFHTKHKTRHKTVPILPALQTRLLKDTSLLGGVSVGSQ